MYDICQIVSGLSHCGYCLRYITGEVWDKELDQNCARYNMTIEVPTPRDCVDSATFVSFFLLLCG